MTASFRLIFTINICLAGFFSVQAAPLKISADHPGGNGIVLENTGNGVVKMKPDLRGGRDWFYWNFEATPTEPGDVEFIFEGKLRIGVRGPAVSRDGGKTWQWLGYEAVRYFDKNDDPKSATESFTFRFEAKNETVRFAVAIPYQKKNLDDFVRALEGIPDVFHREFTKSRSGKSVKLIQIGKPFPEKKAIIVTARHHACESMASYVLEGFLAEAASDSQSSQAFRDQYVIYAIPMMDSDGVQAGDQGKWRFPHDHNRDYGTDAMYPEVQAVMALAQEVKPTLALDFHCPSLRGETHEVFYFIGIGLPHIDSNTNELRGWIAEECPQIFPRGPHNFLRDPPEKIPAELKDTKFSAWFSYFSGIRFAATFEIPYSQRNFDFTPDMAREYGRATLQAWAKTEFVTDEKTPRKNGIQDLLAYRKKFHADIKSNSKKASLELSKSISRKKVQPNSELPDELMIVQENPQTIAELGNLRGLIDMRQRDFESAKIWFEREATNTSATESQRMFAATQLVVAVTKNEGSTANDVLRAVKNFEQFPYPSTAGQFEAFGAVADCFEKREALHDAMNFLEKQLPHAKTYEKGAVLNRIADLSAKTGDSEKALRTWREAVTHLRTQLDPEVPVGIFGVLMARDLFEALIELTDTPQAELEAAAEMIFQHKVASQMIKDHVRAGLAAREKK